jgi:hypothetical protein
MTLWQLTCQTIILLAENWSKNKLQKRKAISQKTKKLIWQEAINMCVFCENRNVDVLEIHHIIDWSKGGTDEFENLILVCSNCHSKITNGSITTVEVFKAKMQLQNPSVETKQKSNVLKFPTVSNSINVSRSNNYGIIANTVKIPTQRKTVKFEPPVGTIGSDGDKRSYIMRLIERYQDFKKAEHGLINFRYQIIYSAIKKEFKCKWDFIRLENFSALVNYLQRRIDNTRLGRNRKSKGLKNYSSFQEFLNHADSFQDLE